MIDAGMIRSLAEDSRWLTENYERIRSDDGKVVAVKGRRIILETKGYEEMLTGLREMGEDPTLVLVEVIPSRSDSFIL